MQANISYIFVMLLSKFTVEFFSLTAWGLCLGSLNQWEVLIETLLVAVEGIHTSLLLKILPKTDYSFLSRISRNDFGERRDHLILFLQSTFSFGVCLLGTMCFTKNIFSDTAFHLSGSNACSTWMFVLLIHILCLYLNYGLRSRIWKIPPNCLYCPFSLSLS